MNWEITGTPSGDEPTTRLPRRPRHRSPGQTDHDHWWRSENRPVSRRSVDPDDTETRRTDMTPARQVLFPGTGSIRAVVGPWTVLAPEDAERPTTRIPLRDRGATAVDDAPTTRLRTTPLDHTDGAVATRAPAVGNLMVTRFPEVGRHTERGLRAWFSHTGILTGRQTLVVLRDRVTLLQTLLFPALSMIMFKVVLGDAIGQATGQNSAFGTVPLVVLVGAMFGSMAGGVRLTSERKSGLLTRLYVLPVHRGADFSSRIAAELMRILVGTVILTFFGMIIGWRFDQGFLPALGIFAVALLYGAAFFTIVLALALSSSNIPLVPILSLIASLFMFFNSGFSPVSAYPEVLQPLVSNQPMTCAIDTMRALAIGGPVTESLVKTVLWAVGGLVVFGYPALRAYRRAAVSRD
ncbi:ABC transporter permease [Williamsia sp. MIQD14]|uniref:ABC transporter permease n=1 Tax=Williamsia sp. MIQD14 TaxID=3425703 RepID=UPI003D9FD63E